MAAEAAPLRMAAEAAQMHMMDAEAAQLHTMDAEAAQLHTMDAEAAQMHTMDAEAVQMHMIDAEAAQSMRAAELEVVLRSRRRAPGADTKREVWLRQARRVPRYGASGVTSGAPRRRAAHPRT